MKPNPAGRRPHHRRLCRDRAAGAGRRTGWVVDVRRRPRTELAKPHDPVRHQWHFRHGQRTRRAGGPAVTIPDLAECADEYDLIVLEGCDGAGKTTMADALAAHHGYAIVHATRTPEGIDLVAKYSAILARPGPLVLDRSFVSELVYGPLERGRSRLTISDAAHLAAAVAERGGILVHLTGQPEEIVTRLLARDGHAPGLERIRALTAAYADVVHFSRRSRAHHHH
jgi:predicted ATPase